MTQTALDDTNTPIELLRKVVADFVCEREWEKYHSPKNLSMALAIEAAELMEHFQWISPDESRRLDDQAKKAAAEELADVVCYSLAMASQLGIDLTSTVLMKMEKNCKKYPAEEFRGQYKKV